MPLLLHLQMKHQIITQNHFCNLSDNGNFCKLQTQQDEAQMHYGSVGPTVADVLKCEPMLRTCLA